MKVTAAVITENGKILLARRKPGGAMGGRWEFPGGKIEPGETPEQSLERELREELAIQARIGEFLLSTSYEGDGVSLELLVYRAERIRGEPVLIEHDEISWVRPRDLAGYDLADSDRKVVEELYR
ncbi:MAG TPA: 8-oxo-dGTP diphosphatase MutT [Spirochaetia bacterium]|nr:8-oxo-dGTP diphosphatase MutT [Spirochaetia bacterium]